MQITCPKCGFKQDIPDEKIPPKAEKATCPQCHEKFRFRKVQQEDFLLEPDKEDRDKTDSPPGRPDSDPSEEHYTEGFYEEQDKEEFSENQGRKEDESLWSSLEDMGEQDTADYDETAPSTHETGFDVPWENLDKAGFFPGFIETIKRVMLAPAAFFYKMPFKGLVMPLAFFLMIMVIQALATFIWNMAGLFPAATHHGAGEMGLRMMGFGSIFIVIFYPLLMGVWLFIASGITHLFLMLFQAEKRGFEGTFRATAYGSAPMILGILPFLGPIAGALWSLGVTIIGYKNIHETSFLKVIMAMFAPIFVMIILAALMY